MKRASFHLDTPASFKPRHLRRSWTKSLLAADDRPNPGPTYSAFAAPDRFLSLVRTLRAPAAKERAWA